MKLSPRWKHRAVAALAAGLITPTAHVAGPAAAAVGGDDDSTVEPAAPLLAEPVRGNRAIERLGTELPVSAARNDLRPAELRSLLREDHTAWLDEQGAVHFVEPARDDGRVASPEVSAQAPLSETFTLHSNSGTTKKIFLDFDGAEVSGTGWNASYGVTPGLHPGWDPDGDGAAFNDAERAMVQQVWAMVAEDYAPFDVDVTTQDPGVDGLTRSSSDDPAYGTRVLISESDDAFAKICQSNCGGVAYLNVYGDVGDYHQPAWVFPQGTGNVPKAIAEAAAHEAGHNLGLQHDGTSSVGYYSGHGIWAPIMGVGYYRPLSQWSAGSYTDANNPQDDLGTIASYLGTRPDEASGSIAVPSVLPTGEALIGDRDDVDAFQLGRCTADSAVTVAPAALAPNLDIRVTLYDATGAPRSVAEPVSGVGDGVTAAGLGGTLTVPTDDDGWVLSVEGAGQGAWNTGGYDDYGSVGAYTVTAPGCTADTTDGAPGAPESVTVDAATTDSLTLTWSPPATVDSPEITGYVVGRSGSADAVTLPSTARSHTFTGLTPGTGYQLSVRAVSAAGAGPTVTVDSRTAEPPPAAPTAPRDVTGSYDQTSGKLQVWWNEPADSGSQPISAYAIYLDGNYVGQLPATSRGAAIARDGGYPPGQYVVGVAAVNEVGSSPIATVTITRELLPPASPGSVVARPGDTSATVSWAAPADNGSPITAYRVTARAVGQAVRSLTTSGDTASATLTGLTNGTSYAVTISATNAAGTSAESTPVDVTPDIPDTQAPTIGDIASTARKLDPFFHSGNGVMRVRLTDDREISGTPVMHIGPSDGSTFYDGSDWTASLAVPLQLTKGDRRDGIWTGSYTVPFAASDGSWNARMTVQDVWGNATSSSTNNVFQVVTDLDLGVPPAAPSGVTATAGNARVRVSWTAPAGAVSDYTVWISPGVRSVTVDGPDTSTLIDGLDNNTAYTFTVVAGNQVGESPESTPSGSATPTAAPTTPVAVTALARDGAANVSWTSPYLVADVTSFRVTSSPGDKSCSTTGELTCELTGLTNGTAYTFSVIASNTAGQSPTSTPSNPVTPAGAPERMAAPTAVAANRSVEVSWPAAADNGSPITGYTVTATPGGQTCSTTGLTCTVTGLTNGTAYTLSIAATNAVGQGASSPASTAVTPAARPGKVRPKVVVRRHKAIVSWRPAAPHGARITRYLVDISKGRDRAVKGSARRVVFKRLRPGRYRVRVAARNAVGTAPQSRWVRFRVR